MRPGFVVTRISRLETRLAVAAIVALILAAFWKVTLLKGVIITDDIFASDLMNENFPYRFALGKALQAGQWPLWVREIYGGFPLLARSEAGVCYPFNIVFFGLLPPYVALNFTILLTLVIAAVGMYFYARDLGGTNLAALLGGVAFAFSGFLLSHLKHLSMFNAACWLPAGLLCLERAIVRDARRPLLWFAAVFGLQHLSGNAQIAYYCGLLYTLYFPLRLLNRYRDAPPPSPAPSLSPSNARPRRRLVFQVLKSRLTWCFAGAIALGSLLAAVQMFPTYELVSLSHRSGGVTFEYASRYAYDLKSFWSFFLPYVNGDIGNLTYTGKGIFWEDYGYVGLLPFLLACYAALRVWNNWHVRFFAITAVASFLLVLGPATPLYSVVFHAVPAMKYFRFPTRLLLVTDLSLVALAALGLTRLAAAVATRRTSKTGEPGAVGLRRASLVQIAAVLLAIGDLLHFQMRLNPIVDADAWMRTPTTAAILGADPSLFRVFSVGGNHSHRRTFAQAHGWEGDLQPFVEQREFLQPSSNVLYGLSSPNGYANLIPTYLVDVWGDQNRAGVITRTASSSSNVFQPAPAFWKLMRMYNVKYLTSFWPFAPAPNLAPLGVYGGAFLYRNDDFLPRAYLVSEVSPVSDDVTALRILTSDGFDPRRSVLLDAAPSSYEPGKDTPGGSVEFLRYTNEDAELKVRASGSRILVFSDSYYPGWIADVDGRATPIYRANVTQRAVVVPSGDHIVRFHFRSMTVVVGLWVSLASFIILLGGFCFRSPEKREPPGMTAKNRVMLA
ncbi:MAG: YfhO family protein [Myxococcales bacterium]